ncbi:MAG: organoarsenical effux MFS transporter ArsJ [Pseudomonadales bacterium]
MHKLRELSPSVRQYLLITGNYWAFTLTDGALRMLVVLHFHSLGYTPLEIALLFVFYEAFGIVSNLLGGWFGAHFGLNKIMNVGLGLQVLALSMLLLPAAMLTVPWVMGAQALSGIAKDLNKMSAKSSVKLLVPGDAQGTLYKWVSWLTGSKNALKGIGFFLGGALLASFGFKASIAVLAMALALVWIASLAVLQKDLGKAKTKPKFAELLSKSRAINFLSAARLFLFGARDVWFVVALPVYLGSELGWSHMTVGSCLAFWVIGYGAVQSLAPSFTGKHSSKVPDGKTVFAWAAALTAVPTLIAFALMNEARPELFLLGGLALFGILFAVNSSMHSYLIVSYSGQDGISLDIGFYYMANAAGRLIGTVLSGFVYQQAGLEACMLVSSVFLGMAALLTLFLPRHGREQNPELQ